MFLNGLSPAARFHADDGAERTLDVLEGSDAVERATADWRILAEQGGVPTPFQSFPVALAAAAAHVRRGEIPRLIIVRRSGRPVVIMPAVVGTLYGARVLRFLGDPLIQYGDVIAAPDVAESDLAVAAAKVMDAGGVNLALFRHVRDDARIGKWLAQTATEVNLEESLLVDFARPSSLTSRNARELRRLRRRLADIGAVHSTVKTGADAESLLIRALELKRDWLKAQGLASKVIGNPEWERALREICRAGAAKVVALGVDGRFIAFEVALLDSACWYGFLGVFNAEFARMGPGQVLTADCLEIARNMGLTCYDQLPPVHDYKRQHATRTLSVRDFALPLTPVGRLAAVGVRLVPEMKSLFKSLPTELRRPLLAFSNR